jgi:hypothetical protein
MLKGVRGQEVFFGAGLLPLNVSRSSIPFTVSVTAVKSCSTWRSQGSFFTLRPITTHMAHPGCS